MADNPRPGTYFEEVWTLHKGSFIVIDDRPCKIVEAKNEKDPISSCINFDFVAHHIFSGGKHEYSATGNERCEVPDVQKTLYRIVDIKEDGRLVLRTMDRVSVKRVDPDLKLPYDDQTVAQIRADLYTGEKVLLVDVKSAMGEEHITNLKELKPQSPKKRILRMD